MKQNSLLPSEIEKLYQKIRQLSNLAQYKQAYALSKTLKSQYPNVIVFAYCEAVFTAEDDISYSPAENRKRFRAAAKKLKLLLCKMRGVEPELRASIRNEYYWFSKQPRKQYALGRSLQRNNPRRAFYSQGVGAAELAKHYGMRGSRAMCLHWARHSEKAWHEFLEINPNWYNAYFFYAMALGFQGQNKKMEIALSRAAKISRKPVKWKGFQNVRKDVAMVIERMNKS